MKVRYYKTNNRTKLFFIAGIVLSYCCFWDSYGHLKLEYDGFNDIATENVSLACLNHYQQPNILLHPEKQSVTPGMVVEFKVKATGECLQFQWKKDCKNLHDDSKYRGTKTDTLHIKEVEKSDKGCYQCLVKNHVREKFSEEAALTVSKLVSNVVVFLLCFMYIILVK